MFGNDWGFGVPYLRANRVGVGEGSRSGLAVYLLEREKENTLQVSRRRNEYLGIKHGENVSSKNWCRAVWEAQERVSK